MRKEINFSARKNKVCIIICRPISYILNLFEVEISENTTQERLRRKEEKIVGKEK